MSHPSPTQTRDWFALPEGIIYLDGNSLGPLPRKAADRIAAAVTDEWGGMLITGWNKAGWMEMPARLGDRIGRLIGAPAGSTVLGDTLSIKVFQALAASLSLRPDRKVILSDSGNFPSDLYIAQGLIGSLGKGHELRVVAPEELGGAIDEDVAALLVTEVDYRTGRRHDMAELTRRAHEAGALAIWDLAHSAGAVPVDVGRGGADFAVGCTYKFLNGGPGAPAFIHVAPCHADAARPALAGWLGHDAPFAFEPEYRPGAGVARMRVGTPPVLQMAALEAALDIWDQVDMEVLHHRRIALSERFIEAVEATCPGLRLASPRDAQARGAQVSFHHPQGYAVMQALIAEGVIGDFRAPDILRFGITPLYIGEEGIDRAAAILSRILGSRRWDDPAFHARNAVT
ncbi:kynureninase [Profundibacterium mesophilum]|uniref:Kynureninase n=1 Tax=Profundibacterium mesophilum KAUST100406-0324 TaxID=1037889 RepID=A0A921TE32_9RHOB|nr:kynureninase [Profundibacterium mesophilum]KAF0674984.1 kynureninase [Profundibacterium mesophilum KAUST100406-0324]